MILHRADERERSRDVVIGHNQGAVEPIVDIIFDRSELAQDARMGPILERAPKVHADQFSQHRGIGAFEIVLRERSHRSNYFEWIVLRASTSGACQCVRSRCPTRETKDPSRQARRPSISPVSDTRRREFARRVAPRE